MKTPIMCAMLLLAVSTSAKDIAVAPSDSLAKARDAAKSGDRIVLKGGTYRLAETLVLGPQNSGVTWMAVPGEKPVISGGVPVTGWTADKDGVWKAKLDRKEKLRQLYVNGSPAKMAQAKGKSFSYRFGMMKDRIPARGPYGEFKINGDESWAIGKGSAPDGIRFDKADLPAVAHPEDLEIRNQPMWTMNRLCIRGMKEEGNQRILLFKQPFGALICTQGWNSGIDFGNPDPKANITIANMEVFNAREFVDEPGEFYFDRSAGTVYYMPRAGEKMDTAEVVAPVLETLVSIRGKDLKTHASNISFEGLTFAHTGWKLMEVAGGHGACGVQSCALTVKWFHGSSDWHSYMYANTDVPVATVEVNSADHVTFTRNAFALTGSIGLKMENDVCDAAIVGNSFRNIGGSSLNIGHPQHVFIGKQNGDNEGHGPYNIDNKLDKWDETVEGLCTRVHIANNWIRRTGLEHPASVGISVFYGHGITLEHNDLANCPYSGISFGWGWERWDGHPSGNLPGKPSLSLRNNVIRYNKIGPCLQTLRDGGGIYMIGPEVPNAKNPADQQWMEVHGNHVYGFGGDAVNGMHPDNGAQHYYFHDNVFQNISGILISLGAYLRKGDDRVENNYSNAPLNWGNNSPGSTEGLAPGCIYKDNIKVKHNQWPEPARKIMENAGLEPAYRDMLERVQKDPAGELCSVGWEVASVSADGTNGGEAIHAIDGNPNTIWHTITKDGPKQPPQEIVVDMGEMHTLTGFLFWPRQDGCPSGNVNRCAFYVSEDGKTWKEPAGKAEFPDINIDATKRKVMFERPAKGRYFKFTALGVSEGNCVVVPELGVMGE